MLPTTVLLYGKDEQLPEQISLRAGPLDMIYENGDLRYIKYGDRELIRRIYVAIRDRNWGTVPPKFSNVNMDISQDSFRISYDVENKQGDIDFTWQGEITGSSEGTLRFKMNGFAHSTFWRNRIGFCILHPASTAGAACVISRVDGSRLEAALPAFIVSEQPVVPFAEMDGLSVEIEAGLWSDLIFSGDIFEMEDQRNWTDASFKTFCTPLRLPYPVEIEAGTRIKQSVTLQLRDERSSFKQQIAEIRSDRLRFTLNPAQAVPLPALGLGFASHGQTSNTHQLELLRALRLSHLRVDLRLSEPDYADLLANASREAAGLNVPLHIGLLLSANAQNELVQLLQKLAEVRPKVATWLIFPEKELFGGGSPTAELVALARQHLTGYEPEARFAAGTNTDFIFLKRTPPPLPLLDYVTFAINPQVHAFDNASLVETLEAQRTAVTSARQLADSLPVLVSPITLKPRFNPYATGPAPELSQDELPPTVDARQMSLFGAGWTAGSLKYLAEGGPEEVTYYETSGWRGVMETDSGSPLPDLFQSIPGGVFPLYHVFANAAPFVGGEVLSTSSSDPLRLDGLALRKENSLRLLLANFTAQPLQIDLPDVDHTIYLQCLDETNALDAIQFPEEFRSQPGKPIRPQDGKIELTLPRYALARLDFPKSG